MPRTELANELIREERKAQIVAAAGKVFARKGLTDTRIADIAAAAGMSQGLIYRYFASKEEVFAALLDQVMAAGRSITQQSLTFPGTPGDKLRWFTSRLLPLQYIYPEGALMTLHALVNDSVPAPVREAVIAYINEVQAALRQMISDGQAAGQVAAGDPQRLTILLLATFQGLAASMAFLDCAPRCLPDIEHVLNVLKP